MSELIVDLRGLLRRLHEHDVDYVLFGALAMVFYGYVRNTEDLNIAVDPEPENLDRVTEWLQSIDAMLKLNPLRPFGARERWGIQKGSNATVVTSLGQVDVVQQLPGMPEWPQLIEEAGRVTKGFHWVTATRGPAGRASSSGPAEPDQAGGSRGAGPAPRRPFAGR